MRFIVTSVDCERFSGGEMKMFKAEAKDLAELLCDLYNDDYDDMVNEYSTNDDYIAYKVECNGDGCDFFMIYSIDEDKIVFGPDAE